MCAYIVTFHLSYIRGNAYLSKAEDKNLYYLNDVPHPILINMRRNRIN
jgi:hypothetical protein